MNWLGTLIFVLFGVGTPIVIALVSWIMYKRRLRKLLQERALLLREVRRHRQEADQEIQLAAQHRGQTCHRPIGPQPAARSVPPRPAHVRSVPARYRGRVHQRDDVDNSPVVAALLVGPHHGGHDGGYSDSHGGGGDYGGGGDCGGGCGCGSD